MMATLYTSRSAIEAYQDCPRYRYLTYLYKGRGVKSSIPSRPLEMGTALHKMMEAIIKGERDNKVLFEIATSHLLPIFKDHCVTDGDKWTLKKDICLMYGLVRAWLITCGHLLEQHQTLFVENDINIPLAHNHLDGTGDIENDVVILESMTDWVTKDKSNGDIVSWNWKSSKYSTKTDGRIDKSYKDDLQGLLEVGVLERVITKEIQSLELMTSQPLQLGAPIAKVVAAIKQWKEILAGIKVSHVRYVFFIKGAEEKEWVRDKEYTGRIFNDSPLVQGYRNQTGTSWLYAWANEIIKPENKSGKGRLPKGWESFHVHECESLGGGLRERMDNWIEILASTTDPIQPELGNALETVIEIPADKYRYDGDIEDAFREVTNQEANIAYILDTHKLDEERFIRQEFNMHRKRCTYPIECSMKTVGVCYKNRNVDELLAVGELKWREPHHRLEREVKCFIS